MPGLSFKYELENILNLKEQEENVKQIEYARVLAELEKEKERKRKISTSLENNLDNLKNYVSQNIDANKIKLHQNYHSFLENRYYMAAEKVEQKKKETEKQRKELISAMQDKKTLETLKQKKYNQFLEKQKRIDQQIIDEIVSFKFNEN